MLLGLELVAAEVLDVLGLGGGGELAVTELLQDRGLSVTAFRSEEGGKVKGPRALTLPSMSDLTGEKATEPRASGWRRGTVSAVWARTTCLGRAKGGGIERWCRRQTSLTEDGRQGLGSVEELSGGNGIVLLLVDGDVDKRLAEGLDNGAAGGDDGSGHDGGEGGGGCYVET